MNKCEEMEYRLDYDQQLLHHISHISHSLLSNYIEIKKRCKKNMNQQSDTAIKSCGM